MATYKTLAALLTDLTDNNAGLITAFTDQNVLVSAGDCYGGFESVRQKVGLTGTDSTADWSKLSSALNSSLECTWPRFLPQLNTSSKTLSQELYLEGVGQPFPNTGTPPGLNANSPGSGAIVFTPTSQSLVWRNLQFTQGKVWLDLGGMTVECPLIVIENCWGNSISALIRDGSIASGLTRKVDKFVFRNNYLLANDRGMFLNGNGVSRAWIEDNHVVNCTRFGIMNTPATPTPANGGFADFAFYIGNLVEGLSYNGANSNPFITGGRYQTMIGNIAANSVYNGTPQQTNFEPFYFKTQICAIVGNVNKDGGAGQGAYALKGIGRTNSDNSPPGYGYAMVGNVSQMTAAGQYQNRAVWIQTQDANIAHNVFDGHQGGIHVNKNQGDVSQRSFNNTVTDNHFVNQVAGGTVAIVEGGHTNHWVNRNIGTGLGGSGQGLGIRVDSQGLGDMVNYRVQGNTIYNLVVSGAARFDSIHVKPVGTDRALGLYITENVVDLTGAPDTTNVFGITFDDSGGVVNCYIDKNMFIGFPTPANVIRNLTAGRGGGGNFVWIYDNPGFVNDNSGTGTITVGNASVTISHGMQQATGFVPAPAATDISIVPTTFLFGATQVRVTNITNTTFDVVLDAAVATSDWTFSWRCRKTKWSFT